MTKDIYTVVYVDYPEHDFETHVFADYKKALSKVDEIFHMVQDAPADEDLKDFSTGDNCWKFIDNNDEGDVEIRIIKGRALNDTIYTVCYYDFDDSQTKIKLTNNGLSAVKIANGMIQDVNGLYDNVDQHSKFEEDSAMVVTDDDNYAEDDYELLNDGHMDAMIVVQERKVN